jgi:holliday junction DNA helicase RuvA
MLAYIKGHIQNITDKSLIVNVGGLGYEVIAPINTLLNQKENTEITMYLHTHVREDNISLFGFENMLEKNIFQKLISVSGVGPRSAITMLSVASAENIIQAIQSGQIEMLPKIPGVGRKTLEKLILELKDKFADYIIASESEDRKNARLALESLGYNSRDISAVINNLHPELNMNSIIKEALKKLSKV